jgi:glycosyltransferase involved in cell wall biosynthesis
MTKKRLKILMLVPFLPNTSTSGGQTRWYNILKYLSKNHQITLFSLIKDDSERKLIPELEKYCQNVRVFKRPKSPWAFRNLLLTALSWYPLLVIRNFSSAERQALKEELATGDYDLIHAETFYVMPHLPKTSVPTILVEQTIEYLVYKHFVDNKIPSFGKPLFMIDVSKLKYWERFYWKKADKLVAVSGDDKRIMEKDVSIRGIEIIPNGIDSGYFASKKVAKKFPPRVLFVGNFKWLQNTEAADILINKVWPLIIKEKPARLWVVGRSIPHHIKEIAARRKDVEVTESIPDIRDAYQAATVMTVPLKGPGGTRLKVLEALASSLPVVSTSIGVAGLELKDGIHALVNDKIEGLAMETLRVLSDPKLAKKIGRQGQEFVKNKYDWRSVVKLHDNIYADVLRRVKNEKET